VEVRPGTEADSRDVWDWRNDPDTRRQSGNTGFIEWEDHAQWFSQMLNSREAVVLIGVKKENQGKIGVTRFDLDLNAGQAQVSINLNPLYRGQGRSTEFLLSSVNCFLLDHDFRLVARVKLDNLASSKIFTNAGFELATKNRMYIHYRL